MFLLYKKTKTVSHLRAEEREILHVPGHVL
jgi:hypothetical protein